MNGRTIRRRLGQFTGAGYDKGRPVPVQALWIALGSPLTKSVLCPPRLRAKILRLFGAAIGPGALIRHGVHIQWPWKLSVGADSWIGVGAELINLEPIVIGEDVCVSQQVMLCTGSHRADRVSFDFDNAPVVLEDGVWVATRATVLRGVTVGARAVVGATSLVTSDVPPDARVLAPRGHTVTSPQREAETTQVSGYPLAARPTP